MLHQLKLYGDKSEVICFISKHNNKFGNVVSCPASVGCNNIIPAWHVQNLGVIMDQQLSMIDQVTVVCASWNYHLCRLSSIQHYLTPEATGFLGLYIYIYIYIYIYWIINIVCIFSYVIFLLYSALICAVEKSVL